mgnify:CR=1 FL=1
MSLTYSAMIVMLALGSACSKKPVVYSKEQMWAFSPKEGRDRIEIVLARDINDAIPCSDYGPGCLSAHRLKTRDLEFIAVEFATPDEAENSAKKIYAFTVQNWLFDDVDGEPQLEDWLRTYYRPKSFNPKKQR